jgi:hypothetical protein
MSFLYLTEETEPRVDITKEGMQLPEVIALYKTDKTRDSKSFFKKCITYIYYTYNPDGMFKNILPSLKRKKVCETFLKGTDWKELEDNRLIQDVIRIYIDYCTTPTEKLIFGVIRRIDELLQRLDNIPLTRKIKIEIEHDGTKHTQMVDVDNSEESARTLKLAKELIEYQELLKKKLKTEKDESKKKEEDKYLFEQ